jgi:hypothetical protein
MKRIDRSSKGHYESETASRTATLGLHNPFEPYSNKLPLGMGRRTRSALLLFRSGN